MITRALSFPLLTLCLALATTACGGLETDPLEESGLAASTAGTVFGSPFVRSDWLSQAEIDAAGGSYRLALPRGGVVYVKELRPGSGSTTSTCLAQKASIATLAADAFAALPPTAQTTWLRMQLYDYPELGLRGCIGLGAGCYIIVSRS